jgi:hypothetical protein
VSFRDRIRESLTKEVPAASLSFFRFVFGLILFGSMVRFLLKGWVEDLYLAPTYHFKYYGFEFIQVLPAWAMYGVFAVLAMLALFIAVGFHYRIAVTIFFLLFTYVELIDKSTYLNHYYFVSLITFLMIWLSLHGTYSIDARRRADIARATVPNWMLLALKLQIGFVYFFGGIAKLKSDWLFDAQPLTIWLSANSGLPIIGPLLDQVWVAHVLSWGAMVFDLTIFFVLLSTQWRAYGYVVLLVFHFFTAQFFAIGMFPYLMSAATLVFFSGSFHERVLCLIASKLTILRASASLTITLGNHRWRAIAIGVAMFLGVQILLPFRHMLYANNVAWSEEAFRFSWNIMLVEKTGHVEFVVRNSRTGAAWREYPSDYLTRVQEKMMSTQPDMILEFAHYLESTLRAQHGTKLEVYADSYVSLNGRPSRQFIDPTVDLTTVSDSYTNRTWVLPFDQSPETLYHRAGL